MKRLLACLLAVLVFAAHVTAFASLALSISDVMITAGETVSVYYDLPDDGMTALLLLDANGSEVFTLFEERQDAGFHEVSWDGTAQGAGLPSGSYDLALRQGDKEVRLKIVLETPGERLAGQTDAAADGFAFSPAATEAPVDTAAETASVYMPALRSVHTPAHDPEGCYWCTPMDITDEAAVWKMLTSPIYTLNENQKQQVIIRAEPSENAAGVGVVTGTSMGVHVLENRSDGWSLIECYSASFFDSRVKAWNAFVTGYVKTSLLQTKTPDQEYGIVIDKLTQKLYLFHEGQLMTTLAVSTGLYNERQPYNETRSGEFLLVSKVGDFRSDAMICSYAIRFDGGDLLHEVPHVKNADGGKNYKSTEYKLGTRGSHGCIRVQRLKNADGVNMLWLWNHLNVNAKSGTRMVIWEDFQGRQIPIPSDDTVLYYNKNGGSNYHAVENCPGVRSQYLPLSPFTYGELDGAFSSLTPCPYCQPVRRKADIEAVNREHLTASPGMVADYHQK